MNRTFEQSKSERFAHNSRVPVINGLTNEYPPCQILADIYTFLELRGPIQGRTVAWVGDANNMAYTWVQAAAQLGFALNFAAPPGYGPDPARITRGPPLTLCHDPRQPAARAGPRSADAGSSNGSGAEGSARR